MIDYFFVYTCFFFAMGFSFFILAMNEDSEKHLPRKLVYMVISTITNLGECLFITVSHASWGPVVQWPFFFLGFISFIFIVLLALQFFDVQKVKRWTI